MNIQTESAASDRKKCCYIARYIDTIQSNANEAKSNMKSRLASKTHRPNRKPHPPRSQPQTSQTAQNPPRTSLCYGFPHSGQSAMCGARRLPASSLTSRALPLTHRAPSHAHTAPRRAPDPCTVPLTHRASSLSHTPHRASHTPRAVPRSKRAPPAVNSVSRAQSANNPDRRYVSASPIAQNPLCTGRAAFPPRLSHRARCHAHTLHRPAPDPCIVPLTHPAPCLSRTVYRPTLESRAARSQQITPHIANHRLRP